MGRSSGRTLLARRHALVALAATAAAALVAASLGGAGVAHAHDGGTFLMASFGDEFQSVDPLLAGFPAEWPVLEAACAQLLRTPDAPYPAAYRVAPEVAAALPRISDGGRTYTFTIRTGFRFNTGAPVTARDFAYTLNRLFNPALQSALQGPFLPPIVGGRAVQEGKATTARGIVVRGNKLIVTLTRPSGAFTAHMSGFDSCVLPSTLPVTSEGVQAPVPSAGPYYISEFVPGERVVLERNRFYRGTRPHHVDRIVVDLSQDPSTIVDKVDRGELDYAWLPSSGFVQAAQLEAKYGVNKSRFFVAPSPVVRGFVLNTSRPLFRDNAPLRQAVNFALDRDALRREWGPYAATLTDQYLPPGLPGFEDADIYPLREPDFATAQKLARGHRRSGKVVVYVPSFPLGPPQGEIIKRDLEKIGLDVEVDAFPPSIMGAKLLTPGEPWDIGWGGFFFSGEGEAPDPSGLLEYVLGSYYHSPKVNRLVAAAERLPPGPARNRAYGALDLDLTRNAAIAVTYGHDDQLTLVSQRTGCVIVNPYLDLAAVCLK